MNFKSESYIQTLIKRYFIIQTLRKYTLVWLLKCNFNIYPGLFILNQKSELEIGKVSYSSCALCRSKDEEDEDVAFKEF